MLRDPKIAQVVDHVAPILHRDDVIGAAKAFSEIRGLGLKISAPPHAIAVLTSLLHWLLNQGAYAEAARLLWSPSIFSAEPYAAQLVWDTLQGSSSYLLMGAASMSKSYAGGAWHLLDWVRDPEYTTVQVVGPSENHLEANLFSHLIRMHRESKIPLPGQIGELFIGLDPRDLRSSISGVIIPPGKKGGRLQGTKRTNRPTAHPVFGVQSRLRIFIDEMEKVPPGVWKDVDNVFSNMDSDVEGFKIGGAFNPEDPSGACAIRCEPIRGWESIDRDKDDRWVSKRGWNVCRLNAMKSENVIQRRKIFPGLQTREGVERIVQNAGGWNSAGVYTMVYALFPPRGMVSTVINAQMLSGIKADYFWVGKTLNVGGVDVALEGGDTAYFAAGRVGMATGYRTPDGVEVHFLDESKNVSPRPALQMDQLFALPKADTVGLADEIKKYAKQLDIPLAHLMLDRTGNGAGVHDVLKSSDSGVMGVNYSENASETKVLAEDTDTAILTYDRALSELWFALRKWLEVKAIMVGPYVDTDELFRELTGRQVHSSDRTKKQRVESKKDYKDRNGGASPDRADAFTLLLHGARKVSGFVPSMVSTDYSATTRPEEPRKPKVGVTDRLDSLED